MRFLKSLPKKYIQDKTCVIRFNFDIENENDSFRLQASLPTLKFLLKSGSRVVIVSHRGRPENKIKNPALWPRKIKNSKDSLQVFLPFLRKKLGVKPIFFDHFDFKKMKRGIEKNKQASLFVVENIRLLSAENENSEKLGHELSALGDFYVNEDFAASHRNHASFVQIPKFIPGYAGLLFEKEIKSLDGILKSAKRPFVVIVGGAKVPEKLGVIKNLLNKADCFLVGGIVANTLLKARGFDIKKSLFDEEMLSLAKKLIKSEKIILPIDFLTEGEKIMDIGPLTVKLFIEKIKRAKTILWNGPMGFFENKKFAGGSYALARAVAASHTYKLAGGGETTQLIQQLGLVKKISFMSTGGGAMLEYLGGRKLPGIVALEN